MNPDFQAAAVSYFGLPEGTMLIPSDPGYLAFHVVLDAATLTGIGERMRTMAQSQEPEAEAEFVPDLPVSQLRDQYNALSQLSKAKYGSFSRYLAAMSGQRLTNIMQAGQESKSLREFVDRTADGREVTHVDAPVEEDSGLPEAVWVHGGDLSNAQISMASDHRAGTNEWLVQVIMLDVAQMAKYVPMRRANA